MVKQVDEIGTNPVDYWIDPVSGAIVDRAVTVKLPRIAVIRAHEFCGQKCADETSARPAPARKLEEVDKLPDVPPQGFHRRRHFGGEPRRQILLIRNDSIHALTDRPGEIFDFVDCFFEHAHEDLEMTQLVLVENWRLSFCHDGTDPCDL